MKVPVLGVGILVVAMSLLGFLLLSVQRTNFQEEARLRARTFLDTLAVECIPHLASSRLDALDSLVTSLVLGNLEPLEIRFVAILDPERRVLAHTDQSQYGRLLVDAFSIQASQMDEPVVLRASREGEDLMMASRPLVTAVEGMSGIRWGTLVAGIGMDRVEAALSRTLIAIAGSVVLVTIFSGFLLVMVLNRQVVHPIQRLDHVAHDFAEGRLDTRARVHARDEIGRLSATFNRMADSLDDHTRNLEDQIGQRTRELLDANRLLAEANARLRELATTDGLTGLYNFRHFETTLRAETMRAHRHRMPLSVLMIDVDLFKAYNDTHGHPAGDQVLRDLGNILRGRVRVTDIPCRYGGEEFAAILIGASSEEALGVAEDLRSIVEAVKFKGEEAIPGGVLTISIGVATFPDDAADAAGLVKASDKALYRAKQAGRNRVEPARPG
jgi:diguanylate cyclase (GGDEF)-like protein